MEIKINKEIREYKEKIFLGLSLRQFIFSLLACGIAVLLYFLLRDNIGLETLSWICILGATPFAALGFIRYNGMNAEQFIIAFIKSEILMPKVLLFKSENMCDEMLKSEYKKIKKEERKRDITKNIKKAKIKTTEGEKQNTQNCTTGNSNKKDIRRWDISSWEK